MPIYPRPKYLSALALGIVIGVAISLATMYIITPSLGRTATYTATQVSESCSVRIVNGTIVLLPLPQIRKSSMPIELALAYRRSIRSYLNKAITIEQLSQLLWAADGVNDPSKGFRTAPSAGATYPLVIYVVVGSRSVELCGGKYLRPGSYVYNPYTHSLKLVRSGDLRAELAKAALGQRWVREAPIDIVIFADFQRTVRYYGSRGYRYVYMEAGHVGQNIYLEATALGLGTVAVGAFRDDEVRSVVGAKPSQSPIYIFPVGVPKTPYRVSQHAIQSFIEEQRASQGLQK